MTGAFGPRAPRVPRAGVGNSDGGGGGSSIGLVTRGDCIILLMVEEGGVSITGFWFIKK